MAADCSLPTTDTPCLVNVRRQTEHAGALLATAPDVLCSPPTSASTLAPPHRERGMIQLTTSGLRIVKDDEWAAQQRNFAERHCVVLKNFVDDSLAPRLVRLAETGQYEQRERALGGKQLPRGSLPPDAVVARELTMPGDEPLARTFDVLLNQRRLFDAIAELTGATKEIRRFMGRGYKRGPEHFSRWHNDLVDGRLYGLGISLSAASGEVLRIRRAKDKEILRTVPPLKPGDARLFRIHRDLEHMVFVEDKPYCGYAGWFVGGKEHSRYEEVMRGQLVRR